MSACQMDSQINHSVKTNEIFQNEEGHFGLKARNGKVLIEPTFQNIQVLCDYEKHQLPLTKEPTTPEPMEYYVVLDKTNQRAIFNANGAIIIPFNPYYNVTLNEHTLTAVAAVMNENNRLRHQLLGSDGMPLFTEDFENIAYIKGTDVIVLIKEDGAKDELYMYNPFTKSKSGPYEAFTIYDEHYDPTMGIASIKFSPLLDFIGVAVRKGDDTWGMINDKGEVVLPFEFDYIRTIPEDLRETYIDLSRKPEGINFVLYAARKPAPSTILFFDQLLNEYVFSRLESGETEIHKRE